MDAHRDELAVQLLNLKTQCEVFRRDGHFVVYKSVSVILRTLLRGSSGDPPLALVVLPGAKLFPLAIRPPDDTPDEMLVLPASATIGGSVNVRGGSKVKRLLVEGGAVAHMRLSDMFDSMSDPLPVKEWGQQRFLRPNWTLMGFIEWMAHKDGGAHFDPSHKETGMVAQWGSLHWHLTIGIGQSVQSQLFGQFLTAFPNHRQCMP